MTVGIGEPTAASEPPSRRPEGPRNPKAASRRIGGSNETWTYAASACLAQVVHLSWPSALPEQLAHSRRRFCWRHCAAIFWRHSALGHDFSFS